MAASAVALVDANNFYVSCERALSLDSSGDLMRLFGEEDFERSRKLMKAVDEINAKYGRDTIRFGVEKTDGKWKTKFLKRSKRYTTCLPEALCLG